MFTDKTTARIVGALFIVATVTAIVGGALVVPMDGQDGLAEVADLRGQVVTGVLLEVVLALSVVGIGVMIFPVLRRRNEGLALGYAAARLLEAVLLLAASMSALVFVSLSRDHGTSGVDSLPALADVVRSSREWTYLFGSMVLLGVGGLILYSLLLRSGLVPVWLSTWGLVGAGMILVRGVAEAYGVDLPVALQALLALPIALNEMVLAVWLIVRGFDDVDHAAEPTRQRITAG